MRNYQNIETQHSKLRNQHMHMQKSIHAQTITDQLFCISQLVSFTKTPKLRLLTDYGYNVKYNAASMH